MSEDASAIASDPEHPSVPIAVAECWQWHYKTCHHVVLTPPPAIGQRCRITGFLDLTGRCPACKDARIEAARAAGPVARR